MGNYARIGDDVCEVRVRARVTSQELTDKLNSLETQRREMHERIDQQFDLLVLQVSDDLQKVQELEKTLDTVREM